MSDIVCRNCHATNPREASFCGGCTRPLAVAQLISMGTGVLTKGFTFDLRPCDLMLGRHISNDLVIPTNLIAPRQVSLHYHEQFFSVRDAAENRLCYVNTLPLTAEVTLQDGDTLKIGPEEFIYSFLPPTEPAPLQPPADVEQLQLMLAIVSEFHASLSLQEVLDSAVDAVLRITRTHRGYAFFLDVTANGNAELREVAARVASGQPVADSREAGYSISQSIIQQVVNGDGSVVIEDALAQQVSTDTIRKFNLKSLVCVPLVTFSQRTGRRHVMGVIYADSLSPTGPLPHHCRPTLQMLAEMLTATVAKWQTFERMEESFLKYQRSLTGMAQHYSELDEHVRYIQRRVNEGDRVKRMSREELTVELDAVAQRLKGLKAEFERLRYLYYGL